MRSLFWRVFASFWLAIALAAGFSLLLGRVINQDAWLLSQHPALKGLAEQWTQHYENNGPKDSQNLLEQRKREHRVDVQVLDENGAPVVKGTFPPRAAAYEARHRNEKRLPWRRLSLDYTSPQTGETYLFIYRIPMPEVLEWQRQSLLWPVSAICIALLVVTLISLWLTLSITRPLNRLRGAVHDLGQTAYQQSSLAELAKRRDELGTLAADFNRMGERVQGLIGSQRQLLRDVSHELRSPLARLRIALALSERADPAEREKYWPRLTQECDRLEALISEILALARLDAEPGSIQTIHVREMLSKLQEDARIEAPEQQIRVESEAHLALSGWPDMLQRAMENLLRNALRFSPTDKPIELIARQEGDEIRLSVRDHGPGVAEEHLARLHEPFFRAPDQGANGHGLGLAIARRAAERHGGQLILANHAAGGFIATLRLPLKPAATL
ncbi:HAMP domain-containing sensor histidine kinase [Ectopseudomonas mendocina]|uniref:histidine kinase n=1 Tax=Ectopseudomonas mendocina TaxID=300 RepID=A0ABZ2RQB7_ECTME